MELINHSPYTAGIVVDMDRNGADTLVLIVKATFDIRPNGDLELSPQQRDIEWADVYAGEPGVSSVLYESDATWERMGTDIALAGHAYPKRVGDRKVDVALRVGQFEKRARVFGDRYWQTMLRAAAGMSAPEPFERIPLVWERSFGGADLTPTDPKHHGQEPRNPVGCGFRAKNSQKGLDGMRLPNIEDPRHLISDPGDRPAPVGFGFVAKSWAPRVGFAGTYDEAWRKTRAPLLPDDYDRRFTIAASDGLWAPDGLHGGEHVELVQLTPNGLLRFVLPKLDVRGSYLAKVPLAAIDMHLVVVFIDTDQMTLTLLWQGIQRIHGLIDEIRWVRALEESSRNVASVS
jgi:hypothetical protein